MKLHNMNNTQQPQTATVQPENVPTIRNTAARRRVQLINNLQRLGFSLDEAEMLRLIQMTFHRWDEAECGDGNDYASWSIERDETTGKPYRCVYPRNGDSYKTPIADREARAQKRLDKIMARHPELVAYHQGDCRGCALYIVRKSDIPQGESINAFYTRGIAVCD